MDCLAVDVFGERRANSFLNEFIHAVEVGFTRHQSAEEEDPGLSDEFVFQRAHTEPDNIAYK